MSLDLDSGLLLWGVVRVPPLLEPRLVSFALKEGKSSLYSVVCWGEISFDLSGGGVTPVNICAVQADCLNIEEAGGVSHPNGHKPKIDWKTFSLAFQSIGIIYGDLGTSPFFGKVPGCINNRVSTRARIACASGMFALYSLLCRYAKVSMIPNHHPEDREETNYSLEESTNRVKLATIVRDFLEHSSIAQHILFLATILGTSMVIGDGILTPSISVLSALRGIDTLGKDTVVWVSIAILIVLFAVQSYGTDKVGFTFAPILSVWFVLISIIGIYDLFHYDVGVLRAFYPKYILEYFKRNGKQAWISLGGIFLCLTGTEAMFADLGHFNVRAIQISFSTLVFPPILIAYIGQAAFLRTNPDQVSNAFYASIPGPLYWPTFVVAVPSAIIASQAIISAAFAIISQSLRLGCFPKVKVVHTSSTYEGQVYIPEVNYILMVACVVITYICKTTEKIGNAFGLAVCFVLVITTCMVTLIMLVVWESSIWQIIVFLVVFGVIELVYLSASLYKFLDGGFLPLLFSAVLMTIMAIWHYVHRKRCAFEYQNKVSIDCMKEVVRNPNLNRVPGIGLICSDLVEGIPAIFLRFIKNMSSLHSVIIFVSVKSIPVSKMALKERFIFHRVVPPGGRGDYGMYRCIVRLGYNDINEEPAEFERCLVEHLLEFIRNGYIARDHEIATPIVGNNGKSEASCSSRSWYQKIEEEVQLVQDAMQSGIVYFLGDTKVKAREDASFLKKVAVDHVYDFIRKNLRPEMVMLVPHDSLLRVGITCEI
ncbi:Potassium transporter 5 [Dionaea muscipula]